jgi:alpha-beta hydrolase superfamily lysophospholipase
MPVLVLHGAEDPISLVARTSALRGKQLEAHVVAGARHDLLHDASTPQTLARIGDWLDRAVPRG